MKVFDHEKDLPIVGKFYHVQCAIIEYERKIIYVPIIGTLHSDTQFSVDFEHYHIDGRFTDFFVDDEGRTNVILTPDTDYSFKKILGYTTKRRKCRRLTTGVQPPLSMYPEHTYHQWYRMMIGKSCKGRKCPHFGTKMLEINGRLECPLHKLQGSLETELIVAVAIDLVEDSFEEYLQKQ